MAEAQRMYEWLELEIRQIKTRMFHVVDGAASGGAQTTIKELGKVLPPSYRQFLLRFGKAKLYRELDYYLLGVLSEPKEGSDRGGHPIMCIGHYDDSRAYFRLPLEPGRELPVFEWGGGGLRRVSATFESWVEKRCADCRKRMGSARWSEILDGPTAFTPRELSIVAARPRFEWTVIGRTVNGNLRFRVHNGSDLVLPFLSLGVRSRDGTFNGGVYLPIADLAPGQTAVIERECYKRQVDPNLLEAFALPDPEPEDRDRYWEFRHLPGPTIKPRRRS
jgi:hypothetical protein